MAQEQVLQNTNQTNQQPITNQEPAEANTQSDSKGYNKWWLLVILGLLIFGIAFLIWYFI